MAHIVVVVVGHLPLPAPADLAAHLSQVTAVAASIVAYLDHLDYRLAVVDLVPLAAVVVVAAVSDWAPYYNWPAVAAVQHLCPPH